MTPGEAAPKDDANANGFLFERHHRRGWSAAELSDADDWPPGWAEDDADDFVTTAVERGEVAAA